MEGDGPKMYEIKIGTPQIAGTELTSVSASGLKSIVRSTNSMMGSDYGEARLSKAEKVLNELGEKVIEMEDISDEVRSDISEIKEAVSRMEVSMEEIEDMKVGYSSMEKSMRELSALYDLISGYTNPFVESANLPSRNGDGGPNASFVDQGGIMPGELDSISEDVNPFVDTGSRKEEPGNVPEEEEKADVEEPGERFKRESWMLKWAQFLLEKVSSKHIPELLAYYRSLNWIDAETEIKMLDYLEGSRMLSGDNDMEGDTIITEDGKVIEDTDPEAWKLSVEDHTRSLEFIEHMSGGKS